MTKPISKQKALEMLIRNTEKETFNIIAQYVDGYGRHHFVEDSLHWVVFPGGVRQISHQVAAIEAVETYFLEQEDGPILPGQASVISCTATESTVETTHGMFKVNRGNVSKL